MLRKEIVEFMATECKHDPIIHEIQSEIFNINLGFLTDLTTQLNNLNFALQGKGKSIFEMVDSIDAFLKKIDVLQYDLSLKRLWHFPCLKSVFNELAIQKYDFAMFIDRYEELKSNFCLRFKDFEIIREKKQLFYNPMKCQIIAQHPEFQMELCTLQCDTELQLLNSSGIEFWESVKKEKYPLLHKQILKLFSMFGSTYICESAFSSLKHIKNNHRNRISNEHLEAVLRLSKTNININIDNIIKSGGQNKNN